jgi:uroporphyrinogen decarboxylase
MKLTHRQRLEKTLIGESPDRVPVAFWHHFPVDDQEPHKLAKATLAFQKQFDFDLIKLMPPSSHYLKDWGVQDKWCGNPEGTRQYTKRAIVNPQDWRNLCILDPQKGYLGKQLTCLEILQKELPGVTPYIQTVFNPLSQVKNLVGPENFLLHIRRFPSALHEGLKIIQETTLRFIHAAKSFGISGIFYATQHATYDFLTEDEYIEFGRNYDLPILSAVEDLWLNMVHLHGRNIMFDLISKYPVQVLNWHDRETPPSLPDGLRKFPGTVCGGIARVETLVLGTPQMVKKEAKAAIEETQGKRLILGTGCVLPLTAPYGNIMAARRAVEDYD